MRRFLAFALALSIGLAGLTASGARAGSPVYEPAPTAYVEPIPVPAEAPAGSSAMPGSSAIPGSGAGTMGSSGRYTVALVGLAVIVIGLVVTAD